MDANVTFIPSLRLFSVDKFIVTTNVKMHEGFLEVNFPIKALLLRHSRIADAQDGHKDHLLSLGYYGSLEQRLSHGP